MYCIEHLKKRDYRLSKVIERIGSLDYSAYNNHQNSFLFLVREIVGQMISSSVKKVIWRRFGELCNNTITPSTVAELSLEQLRSIGLSKSKSSYILNLAKLVSNNEIDFKKMETMSDDEVIKVLTSIKGIGNWTAKMYLLFFLQREDILPYEDGAFLQAYKWLYNTKVIKPESIVRRCKKWKPYTSVGARYMYRALDTGLTKIPIKDFLNNQETRTPGTGTCFNE